MFRADHWEDVARERDEDERRFDPWRPGVGAPIMYHRARDREIALRAQRQRELVRVAGRQMPRDWFWTAFLAGAFVLNLAIIAGVAYWVAR